MHVFAQAMPERFFQMGMAEQLLLGAAAGMAEAGLVPFASTYSVFAARRAYDFLCLDTAEPGLNVNIVGGLPGLTTGYGPSHQATEDVAIFRGMPGAHHRRPVRLGRHRAGGAAARGAARADLPAAAARQGADRPRRVRLHASSSARRRCCAPARRRVRLERADDDARAAGGRALAEHQVDVAVVHTPTLKPFDEETVLAEIDTDRLAVTSRTTPSSAGCSRPSRRRSRGPGSAAESSRSPSPTRSSTPAPCPRCTTATGWPPTGSSSGC